MMINQNYTIITILTILMLSPLYVNAEPLPASIWVPSKVLSDQKYHGIIIVDQNTDSDISFSVVTDNEEIISVLTDNIIIPKGKHHGIIDIETKGEGDAKIFAIHKDTLLEQEVEVVESAITPTKVDLIIPSTLVDVLSGEDTKHTGYVFLLNSFDNPVLAEQPIQITLTSNGDISLAKNLVTIEPGNHYAKFLFETKGEGSITASASNLEPDQADISVSDPSEIELHLEVGPNPVPTGSSAKLYYWLERDNKPYLPPHDVKITVTIDKTTNLSFDGVIKGAIVLSTSTSDRKTTDGDAKTIITRSDAQLLRDATKEFVLQKGTYYGSATIYSSFDGSGDISINGLAESVNPQKDEETVKTIDNLSISTVKSNSENPTETEVFAYPDPAYDKVEIIVSSNSDEGPVLEPNDEDFTVFLDNKLFSTTLNGKIKRDENYGIIIADVKDIGTSEIFAQRNEATGEEKTVEIKTKYVKNPEIQIVPLPVIFGIEQDLFLISSSHDKIITNPASGAGNLISITSRPSFDYRAINENAPVITVRGTVTDLLDEDPVVHVASNAFTATETLEIYNPTRNKIESMHPDTVYAGEPFPLVNYVTDLEENLLRKADLKVSSGVEMGMLGDLVYFNQSGTHGIIFFDKNTVPVESTITISGSAPASPQEQEAQVQPVEQKPTVFIYTVTVENGEGSGRYAEGTNVTLSAPATLDDVFIIKKKLVGWANLPYSSPTVSFEIDSDIETRPIYQQDMTFLFLIVGGGAGAGAAVVFKKKRKIKKKDDDNLSDEEKMIDELLEK